jgi:hypothetical protein
MMDPRRIQRRRARKRPKWIVILARTRTPERRALGPYRAFTTAAGVARRAPRGWQGEIFRLEAAP